MRLIVYFGEIVNLTHRRIDMLNVETKITGKKLILTVDLSKPQGTSGSGKSTIIGTTQGNQPVGDDDGTKFGLNVYRPIK